MVNIGPRPTFGDLRRAVEAYLLDANGDFYGQWVRVDLLQRLRDVQKFESPAALVAQIRADEVAARERLAR
jgi:riboflavin kinase/FMN adenylyltransferase